VIRLWVIYDHPDDYPESFVVRSQVPHSGGTDFGEPLFANTLEEARALIPWGCTRFPRSPDDVPCLVECWME